MADKKKLVRTFWFYWKIFADDLVKPEPEYRFAAHFVGGPGKGVRKRLKDADLQDWRFDFAWVDWKVAVELEGGIWTGGRHTRGAGYASDVLKYNAALLQGWAVYRITVNMLEEKSEKTFEEIRALLSIRFGLYVQEQLWENSSEQAE